MSHPIKIPTPSSSSRRRQDHRGSCHLPEDPEEDSSHRDDRDYSNTEAAGAAMYYGTLKGGDDDDEEDSSTGRSPALTMGGGLAASLSELNGSLSALDEGLAAMRRRGSGHGHGDGNGSDHDDSSSSFHRSGEIPVGSLPDNRLERRRQILASGEGGSAGAAISGVAAASAAAAGAAGPGGLGAGGSRRNKRGTRTDASLGTLGGALGTVTNTGTVPTMAYSYTGGGRGLPSRRPVPPRAPALHAQADSSNRLARMPQMSLPESALDHTDFGGAGPSSSVPVTTAYGSLNDCSFQKYARSRMMQHGSARMRAAQQIHRFNKGGGSPIIEGAEHEIGNGGNGGGNGGTSGGAGQGEGLTNAIGGPVAGGVGVGGMGVGAASLPPDYHSDLVRKRWEDATAGSAAAGNAGGSNKPSPLVLGMDGRSGGGIEIGAAPSPLNPDKKQSSLSAQLNDLALAPSAAAASSTPGEAGGSGLAGALNLGLGASASTESPVGGGGGSGADYGSAGLGRPRGDGSFSDNSYGGGDAGGGGDGPASVTSLTALEILSSSRQSLERRLGSPVGGGAAASSGLSPGAAAANFDVAMGDHQQQQHPAGGVGAHFLPDQPNLHMRQPLQQQLPDVVPFEYSENPPAEKDHLTDDEGAFDLDM